MKIESLDHDFTLETIAPLGRIGLLALATDFNTEQDLRRMLPEGVQVFTNRVTNANPLTLENLRAMAPDITRAAAGILPGLGVDAMIYGCTSGTAAIGQENVDAAIHAACPGTPTTNPLLAACAAFEAFGAKRLSVLTPYIEEINGELAQQFVDRGFEVLNISGFAMEDDIAITMIPPEAIATAAEAVCDESADLLFISCTSLRAASVVGELEHQLRKPVICSNQALAWHVLRLMRCQETVEGYGSLFSKRL